MNGIVLAHGSAKDIFDLHYKTWIEFLDDIEIICPEDDPIFKEDCTTIMRGRSEHSGNNICERQRLAFERAGLSKSAAVVVLEYDVLLFDSLPQPKDMEILGCEKRRDGQKFVSSWYSHAPWVVTPSTAAKIGKCRSFYSARYSDRWLAAVCDNLKIQHHKLDNSYSPFGGNAHTSEMQYDMVRAVFNGAKYIHGNKNILTSKIMIQLTGQRYEY